ncbi:hypothetical protein ACHWQZ_G005807 [Mnemiopsis leidyi]
MVLTHQYLRYANHSVWGVVASPTSNILLLKNNVIVCPALEKVVVWDARKNVKLNEMTEGTSTVTSLATHDEKTIAVGYEDGSVRIFGLNSKLSSVVLSGHTSSVTVLKYDNTGTRLCSGSLDTNVIVWDVVSQSGLFRLKGHRGPINDCVFLQNSNVLITSSKDTYIKLWCLDSQHCFETLTNGRDEVWSIAVCRGETRLIAGSNTAELRVWSLAQGGELGKRKSGEKVVQCELLGALVRKSKERVNCLAVVDGLVFCQNNDSTIELFKVRSAEEQEKQLKRKRKKLKNSSTVSPEEVSLDVDEEIAYMKTIKCSNKLRSISCRAIKKAKGGTKLCCLFNNNKVQNYTLTPDLEHQPTTTVELPGHRSDIRAVRFTSDSSRVLSVSDGMAKLWSCKTQHCIATVECGNGMCAVMAPGDQYAVVGTKKGEVQLLDLVSGVLVSSVTAHSGCVWDIAMRHDSRGFATGSADKFVKFWEFVLVEGRAGEKSRIGVKHVKSLQMTEDVLSVCYSKNNKLLAVSLLDCTVKVFFTDTLKFFLTLYGHKLPVTSMDISSDSTLIVTGSADKNIKIWGLDFGDCHKSIFAHDEAVMKVAFVPKTHQFFSVGKDRKLKQWDADNFEHIQTLEGHQKEVWCVDISGTGDFVATSSHDKSIRLWERTDEPLVLEDERETARELQYEQSLVESQETTIPGENTENEAESAGKKSMETVRAAERIMEAVEVYRQDKASEEEYLEALKVDKTAPPPDKHIILSTMKISSSDYVLDVIMKVRPSELEESLLVLPFHYICDILVLLNEWLLRKQSVELCCKCTFFLLRVHHNQIVANKVLVNVIESLNKTTRSVVKEVKDVIGFNLAALKFLQLDQQETNESFFKDFTGKVKDVKRKKRAVLKTVASG